jgi:tetratricopeptide (TPR) repeat protein
MERSHLAPAPASLTGPVKAWAAALVLPTYEPRRADLNPMFLEKRVFQGSSGRVYPLPFIDRIAPKPVERAWRAIFIENEYLRVIVLPELGGRIYAAIDRTNGYDFVYRNPVIKPALVGLAGPWISGGIEFNWPQHHRPSTYMPTDWEIEEDADGGRTIWLGEHEPMNRMKGMHGVRLSPGAARIELRVRLYNRTQLAQSFMWWANVATDVNERYQSFFPPDVRHVADHAKRGMSAFPLCQGRYYGIDYGERARAGVPDAEKPRQFAPDGSYAANDLRWYANIPVPTSYMCVDNEGDFFGGYDHAAKAGIVHVADHHIAPGKKQWTWGNHEFGYAWDRNLTDPDANGVCHPYIELMAGVYSDNQPDFSFIAPGETKTFTQYWYPIRDIGPADQATAEVAASLRLDNGKAAIGLQAVVALPDTEITVAVGKRTLDRRVVDLSPERPLLFDVTAPAGTGRDALRLALVTRDDRRLIDIQPQPDREDDPTEPATEPPDAKDIASADELYVTGLHLSQYRHATRAPELYWFEALRRDPLDSRCNNAIGLWRLRRGEFDLAERSFRLALERLRRRNPNPYDGEAFYNLGVALRLLGRDRQAYDAFNKATWNAAWAAAGHLAAAEIDAGRGAWETALAHVEETLRRDAEHLRARFLKALCLRHFGREDEAAALFTATLALDPLDFLARAALGRPLSWDSQVVLDLALDYSRMGDLERAYKLVVDAAPRPDSGTAPLLQYYAAYFADRLGRKADAIRHRQLARAADGDYCFPSRVEEILILRAAMDADATDPKAPYYLANLLYDKRRHREAIALWERSAKLDPNFAIVWRNLGIGYFNIAGTSDLAVVAYDNAHRRAPADARVFYERDQLWKRIGVSPEKRLRELEARLDLAALRDDLCIELSALYNQVGQPDKALATLLGRNFQPWEGGEGMALEQYARTRLMLGRAALKRGDAAAARQEFQSALDAPRSLGESKHLLANQCDVHYWLGTACAAVGDEASGRAHWLAAAKFKGDFTGMEVRPFSQKTYYSALSMRKLGLEAECNSLLEAIEDYANTLLNTHAEIDYFATSLPTMLIFEDDLQKRQETSAYIMLAQAALGRGAVADAKNWLGRVRRLNPNHAYAADLWAEANDERWRPPEAVPTEQRTRSA